MVVNSPLIFLPHTIENTSLTSKEEKKEVQGLWENELELLKSGQEA